MTIDAEAKGSPPPEALTDQTAELAAYRAILQNLLLEVARDAGAERLNGIRQGALDAISGQDAAQNTRAQSAAIVEATFDVVAAAAGFTVRPATRDLH